MRDKPIEKVYYSITEVAGMIHVNNSTLRFWEDEFHWISPSRDHSDNRRYKKEDIEKIMAVNILIHMLGMTLEGIRTAHEMGYFDELKNFILDKHLNYTGEKPMSAFTRPQTIDEVYPPQPL